MFAGTAEMNTVGVDSCCVGEAAEVVVEDCGQNHREHSAKKAEQGEVFVATQARIGPGDTAGDDDADADTSGDDQTGDDDPVATFSAMHLADGDSDLGLLLHTQDDDGEKDDGGSE